MAKTRTKLARFYIYDIVFVQLWRVMRAEVSHDFLFFFFFGAESTHGPRVTKHSQVHVQKIGFASLEQ